MWWRWGAIGMKVLPLAAAERAPNGQCGGVPQHGIAARADPRRIDPANCPRLELESETNPSDRWNNQLRDPVCH